MLPSIPIVPTSAKPKFPGSIQRTAETTRSTANRALSQQVSPQAPAVSFAVVNAESGNCGDGGDRQREGTFCPPPPPSGGSGGPPNTGCGARPDHPPPPPHVP